MSKYDFGLDLDSENSLAIIIDMIEPKSKILEFGPANGRMTKYLDKVMQCEVDIVEIDEEAGLEASRYSNKSFLGETLGDIEKFNWLKELENEKYDYIIFADVLEHLHNPMEVLKKCNRILKDNGSIIMSIPNIAHNSVIIDLINDEFKYNELGLLDNTHISFFAYKSLKRNIHEAGYRTIKEKAVYSKVGENEIRNNYNCINKELAKALREREKGNLYQFVFEIKKKNYTIVESCITTVNLDANSEYETVCYVKENMEEYSEFKTSRKYIRPNSNIIKFELEDFKKINEIRIDPINSNCVIDIKNIYTMIENEKVNIDFKYTNGVNIYDSIYIFETNDPQIYLDVKDIHINSLYFEFIFIDFDSEQINKYNYLFNKLTEFNKLRLEEKENMIKEKENIIKEKENIIKEKENMIKEKENMIKEKENIIKEKLRTIGEKEIVIKENKKRIDEIENSRQWKYLNRIKEIIGK